MSSLREMLKQNPESKSFDNDNLLAQLAKLKKELFDTITELEEVRRNTAALFAAPSPSPESMGQAGHAHVYYFIIAGLGLFALIGWLV